MTDLTQDRLKEILSYNAETGEFYWLASGKGRKLGRPAGGKCSQGYVYIGIDGERLRAHRLAWLYVQGKWPPDDLDHINRNRADNRLQNLREATRTQNNANAKVRSDNSTGFRGVTYDKRKHLVKRWRAYINVNGKQVHLGHYSTKEQARSAYRLAAEKFFGEFSRAA